MSSFIDGDFSRAREIEGSGVRTFSQFNTADFVLERLYVQSKASYRPIPISSPDYRFVGAFMVEESVIRNDAALAYIKRTYMTVPSARTERQNIAFTFPGESLLIVTPNPPGVPIMRWDQYGSKRPATVNRSAVVRYTYSVGEVTTDLPTQILFDGQPVDYVGTVYTPDGLQFLGATSPGVAPTQYVVSDTCRQLRGNIWERQRVTVSLSTIGAPMT